MAPLSPTKPFNRPNMTPLLSGKFLTQVTRAPVFAKFWELAPIQM
uniref:Uncharacterized protein n=1 Tax=Rhizophora mucronata TaxID=61149 RepID=A0A2P2P1X9_RHIMU